MRHDRHLEEPPEHPDDCVCRECHPDDCGCEDCQEMRDSIPPHDVPQPPQGE